MNDTEWGQIIDLCIEVGISLEAVGITKDMGFYEALTLVYFYIKGLLEEEYEIELLIFLEKKLDTILKSQNDKYSKEYLSSVEEENEFAYEQVRYQKM